MNGKQAKKLRKLAKKFTKQKAREIERSVYGRLFGSLKPKPWWMFGFVWRWLLTTFVFKTHGDDDGKN